MLLRVATVGIFWGRRSSEQAVPKGPRAAGSKSGPCVDFSCPFLYRGQTCTDSPRVSLIP